MGAPVDASRPRGTCGRLGQDAAGVEAAGVLDDEPDVAGAGVEVLDDVLDDESVDELDDESDDVLDDVPELPDRFDDEPARASLR
ncbi:hypothetical protein [Cellulomonas wangsupingiae]|uniref:Uncharacterized protein n=1 Tax=Cellulomonas wangsupingiae TaxID=2968085 RepID=A0ABY5KCE2_9CELL|nr:hypothetical protein [Cellulomonas wangsupingiae]MCC2334290.1 hypothetical protein [Cellulomonas wangsupingiae]MCM0641289.1 hypothetical protein [Cellulomonas wangsupingiae]UUI67121.1 hypothetical protein NP075_04315 [Cellulomonas wangsupingiae]